MIYIIIKQMNATLLVDMLGVICASMLLNSHKRKYCSILYLCVLSFNESYVNFRVRERDTFGK